MDQQKQDESADNPAAVPARPLNQFVTEAPKFELDSYISNYEGPTRLDRLLVIGISSRSLGLEALRAGVLEAKQGIDATRYQRFVEYLHELSPSDELAVPDVEWIASIQKRVAAETARLEHELKGYKNNLIKESIRMGNEDLGAHYSATGALASAFKAYSRMREYCTTPKHIAEMSLKLLLLSLQQENYLSAHSQIYKIQNLQLKPEDSAKVMPLLAPISGLANMCSGQYRAAAASFVETLPAFMTHGGVANTRPNAQVLTPNDVAIYGGLCALASYSRAELSGALVLENANFRQFLELEPHIRRAIVCFVGSKYTQCLAILESYKTDYLLDVHLQAHVVPLYAAIRRKSVVSYFAPFSAVSLSSMAEAFVLPEPEMEEELTAMIKDGTLEARLDLVDRRLVSSGKGPNDRRGIHEKALKMAADHERALRLRLFKINMLEAGFEIKAQRGGKGAAGGGRAEGKGARDRDQVGPLR